jgi:hypothetical protein
MRNEVVWAIRDSRALNAAEKAFLYAVETRGTAYGTWQTVAADAGMKRDAYYATRRRLAKSGALTVTERPGRTTVHEVNAAWFRCDTVTDSRNEPETPPVTRVSKIPNDRSGNPVMRVSEIPNDPSGISAMKEELEGDPVRGLLKKPIRVSDLPPLNAWDRAEIISRLIHESVPA